MIELVVDGNPNKLNQSNIALSEVLPLFGLGDDAIVVVGKIEMLAKNATLQLVPNVDYELRSAEYHRTSKILSGDLEPSEDESTETQVRQEQGTLAEEQETEEVVRLLVYKTKVEAVDGGKPQRFSGLPPKKKLRYISRIIDVNPVNGASSIVWGE